MMMAGQNDDGACLAHGSYGAVHHVNAKLGYYVNDLSAKDGKRSWQLLAPDGNPQSGAFGCAVINLCDVGESSSAVYQICTLR